MNTKLAQEIALVVAVGIFTPPAQAQQSPSAPTDLVDIVSRLEQQVGQLQATVSELRAESAKYRAEVAELRQRLPGASQEPVGEPGNSPPPPGTANSADQLSMLHHSSSILPTQPSDESTARPARSRAQFGLFVEAVSCRLRSSRQRAY
jgi:hypothetical protein